MKLLLLPLILSSSLLIISCAHRTADTSDPQLKNAQDALYLLNELSKKNAEVDKLMLVKSPGEDVEKHAKSISIAFIELHTDLQSLDIKPSPKSPLPPSEIQTRKLIESTQTERLLSKDTEVFRTNFLLTQISALDYASHLIQYLIEESKVPSEFNSLEKHHTELERLYQITRKLISDP